jgi:protein-S-isoprenylcysteine O-methyltransferase Ste14
VVTERRLLLPPHYFLAALIASGLLDRYLPIADVIPTPFRYVGAIPLVAGLWIVVSSARNFSRHGTAIKPFEPSTALVTSGWYRFTRNPMYLSMLLILIGVAVLLGSPQAFLPAVIQGLILHYRFVVPEEAQLAATFGDRYQEYRGQVRRWL